MTTNEYLESYRGLTNEEVTKETSRITAEWFADRDSHKSPDLISRSAAIGVVRAERGFKFLPFNPAQRPFPKEVLDSPEMAALNAKLAEHGVEAIF